MAGFTRVQSHGLEVEDLTCGGSWRAPELTITNLQAELYQRHLDARAGLDVATRTLNLSLASDVDPHKRSARAHRRRPAVAGGVCVGAAARAEGRGLPGAAGLDNRQPDWRAEVQPTLRLQGEFKIQHGGTYRGVVVTAAQSHISYSNLVWRLPDLTVMRPEGALEVVHEEDDRTKDFYFRISSTLDVRVLRPLLEPGQQEGLDYFTFTEPPVIGVEIWGRGHEPERTGIKGRVALTNFTFRGESASSLQTAFQYTNRLLQFTHPRIQLGAQQVSADGLGADFGAQLVFLTNGLQHHRAYGHRARHRPQRRPRGGSVSVPKAPDGACAGHDPDAWRGRCRLAF